MTRVLLVDDEPLARARIRKYLEDSGLYEIREASDGFAALELIADFKPEIVFLDIEMPELNGFDVLRNIPNHEDMKIIFQTAYDQFAIQAFEVNACDYLLKPFRDDRLQKSLERSQRLSRPTELKKLEDHLVREKRYLDKFVVDVGTKTRIIPAENVFYLSSESHVTKLVLEQVDYAYGQSLTYLEKQLDPAVFLRIHRNCIVRLDRIASFTNGQNVQVSMKNGAVLKASREGGRTLREAFSK
ncbi:MAG TPA: LytTR family DNA-binding domain-containing protein [Bdellovibrionota bacterium]|nr:LytTR family DNA-binding domain-containing protein [Bdellovibrionota bacterium]